MRKWTQALSLNLVASYLQLILDGKGKARKVKKIIFYIGISLRVSTTLWDRSSAQEELTNTKGIQWYFVALLPTPFCFVWTFIFYVVGSFCSLASIFCFLVLCFSGKFWVCACYFLDFEGFCS